MSELLTLTPEGLYCPEATAHIDPVRPVEKAIITHGHADHARAGHGAVLATGQTLDIMAIRYGSDFCGQAQAIGYGEQLTVGGVNVSLHPAGHVLGSAQVLLSAQGERTVVSGDYKRQADLTCAPFELVPCDTFVTEATFGLPVFRHPPAQQEVAKLLTSLELFSGQTHLVGAYALGKAQRVIAELREAGYSKTIYLHGALEKLCAYYQTQGVDLGSLELVGRRGKELQGEIVMCPPGQLSDRWSRRFGDSGCRYGVRLDAGAGKSAPAGGGTATDPIGPCGLGRSLPDHLGNRRRADLGDARSGRSSCALVRIEWTKGPSPQYDRL